MAGADRVQSETLSGAVLELLSTPAALKWAARLLVSAGIEEARFETQILLALALNVSRTTIVAGLRPTLNQAEFRAFEGLVHARARRVPLAYLRGNQEFYGLTFSVTPVTLIPRPETELLVDFALEKLASQSEQEGGFPLLADVGTGTGCIPIAILARCLSAKAIAFDLSCEALNVAQHNAVANDVADRLRLVQGNILQGARGPFDLLLSNPPYIPSDEIAGLQSEVRDFEPRLALDGGVDGLTLLRELAREAHRVLKSGGWLAVEVALGQAGVVTRLFAAHNLTEIVTRRDLAGIERIVCGKK